MNSINTVASNIVVGVVSVFRKLKAKIPQEQRDNGTRVYRLAHLCKGTVNKYQLPDLKIIKR